MKQQQLEAFTREFLLWANAFTEDTSGSNAPRERYLRTQVAELARKARKVLGEY